MTKIDIIYIVDVKQLTSLNFTQAKVNFSVIQPQVQPLISTPLIKIQNKKLYPVKQSGFNIHCHFINTIRLYSLISIQSLNNLETV